MKYIYFLVFTLLFACSGQSENSGGGDNRNTIAAPEAVSEQPVFRVLSADDFEKAIQSETPINLVDVRTPEEVAEGFIAGSIQMNFNAPDFSAQLKTLDVSVPTYVYCRSGGRSGNTVLLMKKMGFQEVYDLNGGITEWMNQNKPVEKL